ncbi:MAG: GTP-binding protein [Candidatus Lokiarchaeota archaeon]|nr:GTP-binding protein [Candidatus Lokiarchaeota archaeon]
MLRQIFVIKKNNIIYRRTFGNALSDSEVEDLSFKIWNIAKKRLEQTSSHSDYFKFRIAYDVELNKELIFIFITGLIDDYFRTIKPQLTIFKTQFLNLIEILPKKNKLSNSEIDQLNSIADPMHRNLKPKIAVVGFSGVGKTTIKKLIRLDEIPLQHVPTITGDIATIKIGDLFFHLFDFAGQEEFRYLWKTFIKGSDAVLVVTDSTQDKVYESSFFLELIQNEVPHARAAIIGNKQDLRGAMDIKEIEKILGLITYPMIANRVENHDKMINIISEILDLSYESTPLIDSLVEKSQFLEESIQFRKEEKLKINTSNNIIKGEESPDKKVNEYYSDKKQDLNDEIGDMIYKERLLALIKGKKSVKIDYIKKFLKIDSDRIITYIFDFIRNDLIECEFNEDNTELYFTF